jgi:hypothetical protein
MKGSTASEVRARIFRSAQSPTSEIRVTRKFSFFSCSLTTTSAVKSN